MLEGWAGEMTGCWRKMIMDVWSKGEVLVFWVHIAKLKPFCHGRRGLRGV